jgi:hypothetical protein
MPAAATTCTCASYAQLKAAAQNWFQTYHATTPPGYPAGWQVWPDSLSPGHGTLLLVTSKSYALSATFRYNLYISLNSGATPILAIGVSTGTDLGAIYLDGVIYARSAKAPMVTLPPTIKPNDEPELILDALNNQFHFTTVVQNSLWHGLFPSTLGQVTQGAFTLSSAPGMVFTMWNKDTIMVQFSNGWTVKIAWTPGTPQGWVIKWDTLKDAKGHPINVNGTPVKAPSTGSTRGPVENVGTGTIPVASNINFWPSDPLPDGTVTIELDFAGELGGGMGVTHNEDWF